MILRLTVKGRASLRSNDTERRVTAEFPSSNNLYVNGWGIPPLVASEAI